MPPQVFAPCLGGQAPCGFRCLTTWCNGPPAPTAPHPEAPGDTPGSGAERVPGPWMGAERALDAHPQGRRGASLLAPPAPCAPAFVGHRPLGPFGHGAAIPDRGGKRVGPRRTGARRGVRHRAPLGALRALRGLGGRGGRPRLEPTPRVCWRRDARDGADTRRAGRPQGRAGAIEAIRSHVLERPHAGVRELLPHRRGPWGLRLPRDLIRPLPLGPPRLIGVGGPRRRDAAAFVDQRLPLPRGIGGKHAHLTMRALAQRPTIVAGHPPRQRRGLVSRSPSPRRAARHRARPSRPGPSDETSPAGPRRPRAPP